MKDRWQIEDEIIEGFGIDMSPEQIQAVHVDDLVRMIADFTLEWPQEDYPTDVYGDTLTPAQIAEYIKAWADRQGT